MNMPVIFDIRTFECYYHLIKTWILVKQKAGPEGFEPSTPGLEGRCFGPDDIILHRSIQTELRAQLADYCMAFLEFWLDKKKKGIFI